MMLEATDLGLGSIWVMSWNPEKLRAAFDLGESIEPVALLIVGHTAPEAQPHKGHLESIALEDMLL